MGAGPSVSIENAQQPRSRGIREDMQKPHNAIKIAIGASFVVLVLSLLAVLVLNRGRLSRSSTKGFASAAVIIYLFAAFAFIINPNIGSSVESPATVGAWSEVHDRAVALRVIHAAGASVDSKVWYRSSREYRVQDGDSFIYVRLDNDGNLVVV